MLVIQLNAKTHKHNHTHSSCTHGCHINECVVWWTETTVSGAEDSMETNEAAAALLNMESPNNILDEKRMSKLFFTVCR